jgi:hypothetical protein
VLGHKKQWKSSGQQEGANPRRQGVSEPIASERDQGASDHQDQASSAYQVGGLIDSVHKAM